MVKRQWTRGRIIGTAALAAAAVVVVLVVLVAVGVLVPAGLFSGQKSGSAKVTIDQVGWTIDQGQTPSGVGWFGPSEFNYTSANGYPYEVTPGTSYVVTWTFSNFDSSAHTIQNVSTTGDFAVRGTNPSTPLSVPAHDDDLYLMITVVVPNDPGASLELNLTVLAT